MALTHSLSPSEVDASHNVKFLIERLVKFAKTIDCLRIDLWMIAAFGFTLWKRES